VARESVDSGPLEHDPASGGSGGRACAGGAIPPGPARRAAPAGAVRAGPDPVL